MEGFTCSGKKLCNDEGALQAGGKIGTKKNHSSNFNMNFPFSFDCGKHISIIHKSIVDLTATRKGKKGKIDRQSHEM